MTNMEDAEIGRGSHRRHGGRSNKPPLIRIHGGGVNLGGLVLFGGALALGGLVTTFIFRKSKDTDDNKKSASLTGDQREQQQQQTSNEASTLEGNQAAAADERIVNCHGGRDMLAAQETGEEINVMPAHHMEPSSPHESLLPDDVEVKTEPYGGAEATKLNADMEIPAGYDDEHEEEEGSDNRLNRSENGSPGADDLSNGDSLEDLEEEEYGEKGEAFFDHEVPETEALLEVKDIGSLAGGAMRMPATESDPKEDESIEDELPPIRNINDGEGEAEKEEATVEMNTQKTEDGVMEEVDGYVEDDDVDDMSSEEEDSIEEMEKDELEMLEGMETWSTDSNAEAVIWPAETIESLAMALEDQLTHLKKPVTDGINNSSRESEIVIEEEDNYDAAGGEEEDSYDAAGESSMLLEKPMLMVNGQIAELISRRIWIFPMLMLLLVMLLFLLTRRNPSSHYQSNAI